MRVPETDGEKLPPLKHLSRTHMSFAITPSQKSKKGGPILTRQELAPAMKERQGVGNFRSVRLLLQVHGEGRSRRLEKRLGGARIQRAGKSKPGLGSRAGAGKARNSD